MIQLKTTEVHTYLKRCVQPIAIAALTVVRLNNQGLIYLITNHLTGSGVTARRLSCLRHAIGSTRNPILFTAIRSRLRNALFELAMEITNTLNQNVSDILKQIGNNIEMLRGSEAKILAKNGDFLEKLGVVIGAVTGEMEIIGEIALRVKNEVEKHDYS